MKSVARANLRVVECLSIIGACALFASACVEGDPIPQDVVERAEGVLLEGVTGGPIPVSPSASASTSAAPPGSVAPVGVAPLQPVTPAASSAAVAPLGVTPQPSASGFADVAGPPVLPEGNELSAEEAIPEDAIPLDEYLNQR